MAKVILFGIGQWASLAHLYLTHDSPHEVVAFTVDRDYLKINELFGLPVVAFDEVQDLYFPGKFKMLIPFSFKRMSHLRAEKYYQAKDKGYEMISYVSSKATTFPGLSVATTASYLKTTQYNPLSRLGMMLSCGVAIT